MLLAYLVGDLGRLETLVATQCRAYALAES